MTRRRPLNSWRLLVGCVLLALPTACTAPVADTTTTGPATAPSASVSSTWPTQPSTKWGFTPFPSAPTEEAVGAAFDFVAGEGNLVAHHFDGSIPWSHLLEGTPLPSELSAELGGRSGFDAAHPDLTVYVATALTNPDRTGIPSGPDGEPPPNGADSFADADVRRALEGWVDLLVDTFEPTYLNAAVEIDMYAANRPDDWENLRSLYEQIYRHVKTTHPEIVVFASFQAELGDLGAFDEVTSSSDMVGVSTYPYLIADGVPEDDYLDRFTTAGLPLAIAETGFPASEVMSPRGTVAGDAATQSEYVKWLGDRASAPGLEFVVWFLPFDIDAFLEDPATPDSAAAFAHLGLVGEDGELRPSLEQWRMNRNNGG